MGLFSPVWKTKDTKKEPDALAALKKIRDPKKLERILMEAPLEKVRYQAAEELYHVTNDVRRQHRS